MTTPERRLFALRAAARVLVDLWDTPYGGFVDEDTSHDRMLDLLDHDADAITAAIAELAASLALDAPPRADAPTIQTAPLLCGKRITRGLHPGICSAEIGHCRHTHHATQPEPQPARLSNGELCGTCQQIVGYGAALESLVRDYLTARDEAQNPYDQDAAARAYEAQERMERAVGYQP